MSASGKYPGRRLVPENVVTIHKGDCAAWEKWLSYRFILLAISDPIQFSACSIEFLAGTPMTNYSDDIISRTDRDHRMLSS